MYDEHKYQRYAEKIRIFNGLNPAEVESIIHQGKALVYREGQTVFHEGQLGSNLFIVLSGKIGIFNKTKMIAKLGVGDAFGEMAVLTHKPRTATAAAIAETRLFSLDEKEINAILEKHVAVRLLLNIIHVLSERLETADALIADIRSLEER